MKDKKVILIEKNDDRQNIVNEKLEVRKLKVCAYARVSTDLEEQANSYQTQISEFTKTIEANDEWEFVKMYSDEGISGTYLNKRTGFLEMIQDARDGKIDMILTKSLSRFARNTVDSLTIIREMRDRNVEIYFEKENIYASNRSIDFIITVYSSIAQEESRNTSTNIKWAYKKRFQRGEVHMNWNAFLGFDKTENGEIVINEDEAFTIKIIYNLYLADKTYREIKEFLEKLQRPTSRGSTKWSTSTIMAILTNEKYCGDVYMQKTFTADYLTHKAVKNTGQTEKYYIADHHPAIIPRETWNLVQELKKRKANVFYSDNNTKATKHHLSGKVYCFNCRKTLQRSSFRINKTLGTYRIVLTCKKRTRDTTSSLKCNAKPIDNDSLEFAISEAMGKYLTDDKDLSEELLKLLSTVEKNTDLDDLINDSDVKIIEIENNMHELINMRLNGNSLFSDSELTNKYDKLKESLKNEKEKLKNLKEQTVLNHKSNNRIKEIKELMDLENGISKLKLYTDYISKVIVIDIDEIIICVEDTPYTIEGFIENMDLINGYKPLCFGTYINTEKETQIKYRVVKIGDELDD